MGGLGVCLEWCVGGIGECVGGVWGEYLLEVCVGGVGECVLAG